jgi:Protein of unknown function (DUF4239)
MVWMTSRPIGLLVIGCLAIAVLVAAVSRLLARALVPPEDRESAYSIAAPLMPALGAAFAILTALTLANEAGYFTSAQMVVSNEAADASRLAWAATSPGVNFVSVQANLVAYLRATRTYEWHGSNAASGDDSATAGALANLERNVRAEAVRPDLGTPASTELLSALDALTSDRRDRLALAARQLPALYVVTLAVSGLALIVNASVLTIRARRRAAVLVGGIAVVVGLTMALLFALGTPWRGPIGVSGQPIDSVIRDLTTGYFHP